MFGTFFGKILNFHLFFPKIPIFSFERDVWRHNLVTPGPILLAEVSMVRRDQYLSTDATEKKVHSGFGCENSGGCNNPRLLDVLQKYVG